jgi:hypothetical protein
VETVKSWKTVKIVEKQRQSWKNSDNRGKTATIVEKQRQAWKRAIIVEKSDNRGKTAIIVETGDNRGTKRSHKHGNTQTLTSPII